MKENSGDGFVRADQIDLKSLDEQLNRHLTRAWTLEKKKSLKTEEEIRRREDWEIDPTKLIIKSAIARGTFGTVHRGVYDGVDVAVKLLDWGEEGTRSEAEIAALRTAFSQEVAVWHKLDHPNVTKFIGATMGATGLTIQTENGLLGMPTSLCCVVVEYLLGGTLKSYLIKNRRRKLAFKVVHQLALDLARGLSYLHSKKIVHRDVKTENMLLDKSRTVKIADFGVARVEAQNPNDMTGETGTLGYMAPEVLNGSPYNRKCDVYSFGICLWEIYCCDMPYPDLSFSEVTSAVVRQNLRPEIPRCCPSSLANVMKKCWDASPDKRPEMDEVGRSRAIKPLVELLGSGTPRGKKDAATALFNLSIFHENKARIVSAGAVKYLVELMEPAAGMVDKAVAVLANLATIPEGRTAIGHERGIPVLVEVVELGSARGKENAAAALLQLCTNSSRFCSQVLQEGAVPPLVALSQSGTARAKEKAQALLSYFRNQRHGGAGRG